MALAAVLLATGLAVVAPPAGSEPSERVGVLVTYKTRPGAADIDALRSLGATLTHRYGIVPTLAASVPAALVSRVQGLPGVSAVERDGLVSALDYRATHDWGIAHIDAHLVHQSGNTGAGVRVAIVDSGVSCEHLELDSNCQLGPTYVDGTTSSDDDYGHGTHVGGTVAAELNAGVSSGVVGVAPAASVIAYKVLNSGGSGPWSDLIAAIDHIWNSGNKRAEVVNMSLGGRTAPTALQQALDRAYASGIVLVAAAGNRGNCNGKGDNVSYPARYASVIAVAAVQQNDTRPCFSSTGKEVELAGPGVSVFSTWPENMPASPHNPQPVCEAGICHYKFGSGTSMASPHVAGVAALVLFRDVADANGANGAADELRAALTATAVDLGAAGRDPQYGFGLVNAAAAVGP